MVHPKVPEHRELVREWQLSGWDEVTFSLPVQQGAASRAVLTTRVPVGIEFADSSLAMGAMPIECDAPAVLLT